MSHECQSSLGITQKTPTPDVYRARCSYSYFSFHCQSILQSQGCLSTIFILRDS
ncbi:Bgt-50913 [Blumeria graminis f. sp. tritici]|uniref:Bgt-50913 n=1 Tax=Blumeria graminis f. sp. tritici TaxID=62690 RepID=A0A9X9PR41_BLUGR|nr:Bgt-50913 [Blumeria graminis f. sp. tritici]